MKILNLQKRQHDKKIAQQCPFIEPTVTEDCFLVYEGIKLGFYLKKIPDEMIEISRIANLEFRSDRVPKSVMSRKTPDKDQPKNPDGTWRYTKVVHQYSTILGAIPKKTQVKRAYATISSVHREPKAANFIKAMLLLAKMSEDLIKEFMPEQYEKQLKIIEENVPPKYRFGKLFTSSISNFNISAPFHRDTRNLKETVNAIICKRMNSKGGDLHVPDFGETFGQENDSILVYPAWLNMHGVTPIQKTHENGYRNSLIFYPLSGFEKEFDRV